MCVPTTRLVRGNNNYIAILLQTRPDHTFSSSLLFFSSSFPTLPCRALASSSATPPRPSPIPYIINSASRNLRSRDLVAGARRLLRKGKKKHPRLGETRYSLHHRCSRWRPSEFTSRLPGPLLPVRKPCRIPSQRWTKRKFYRRHQSSPSLDQARRQPLHLPMCSNCPALPPLQQVTRRLSPHSSKGITSASLFETTQCLLRWLHSRRVASWLAPPALALHVVLTLT